MSFIEVNNLTYSYSKGTPFEKKALDRISFTAEMGELVCVIGHTGSGKSTLMQMLNALLKPDEGEVKVDGRNIHADKKSMRQAHFTVGLCFQYPEYQLFEETCFKDIAFGPANMGLKGEELKNRVTEAAQLAGLDKRLLEVSPFDLSGGQKRRCAIAGVMAMNPRVLIMDEPTAGLDPVGRNAIMDMILNYRKKTGATVFIVTHSMEIAAGFADTVMVLEHGVLKMKGTVQEVFCHADELIQMGLQVPEVTRIFAGLKEKGLNVPQNVYTVKHAARELCRMLKEQL